MEIDEVHGFLLVWKRDESAKRSKRLPQVQDVVNRLDLLPHRFTRLLGQSLDRESALRWTENPFSVHLAMDGLVRERILALTNAQIEGMGMSRVCQRHTSFSEEATQAWIMPYARYS